jgi:hypothetical protein
MSNKTLPNYALMINKRLLNRKTPYPKHDIGNCLVPLFTGTYLSKKRDARNFEEMLHNIDQSSYTNNKIIFEYSYDLIKNKTVYRWKRFIVENRITETMGRDSVKWEIDLQVKDGKDKKTESEFLKFMIKNYNYYNNLVFYNEYIKKGVESIDSLRKINQLRQQLDEEIMNFNNHNPYNSRICRIPQEEWYVTQTKEFIDQKHILSSNTDSGECEKKILLNINQFQREIKNLIQ